MFLVYPAIFYKDKEVGGFSVIFPDFEGATCGDDEREAFEMAQEWLGLTLYDYYIEGKEYPKASSMLEVKVDEDDPYSIYDESFVTLVGVDIKKFAKEMSKETIRKNVTIPTYLNEIGKRQNINFSKVLTEALEKEFEIEY